MQYTVPMIWKDDDDEQYSPSQPEYFQHADHGKQEVRERKAKEKGQLLKLQRQVLRGQVKNEKQKTEDAQEEEQAMQNAQEEQQQQKKQQTFHTETLMEKEEKRTEKAEAHPDAGEVVERNKLEPEVSDEETMSEPG